MAEANEVILGAGGTTVDDVVRVAYGAKVVLSDDALQAMEKSFNALRKIAEDKGPIYGLSTGVGDLAKIKFSADMAHTIQENIVRSHSAGLGEPYAEEVVRAAMFARAAVLAMGYSGVNPDVVKLMVEMLNRDIVPYVPKYGSVGASGDIAPLAHVALAMLGEGDVFYGGRQVPAIVALRSELLEPIKLDGRDGLAIINGPQFMVAIAALSVHKLEMLIAAEVVNTAMLAEIVGAKTTPFDERIHSVIENDGQKAVAKSLRTLLEDSELTCRKRDGRVQDAYSIRCAPQILGSLWDVAKSFRKVIDSELKSASDNPLIIADEARALSGGNFHGERIALWLDFASLLCAELTNLAERHLNRLLNPVLSSLNDFLADQPGPESGLMILQYLAADIASENKVLAHPSSVDNIPVSADQEDHASYGAAAGRKILQAVDNVTNALSAELLAIAKGYRLLGAENPCKPAREVLEKLKRILERIEHDKLSLHIALKEAKKILPDLAKFSELL